MRGSCGVTLAVKAFRESFESPFAASHLRFERETRYTRGRYFPKCDKPILIIMVKEPHPGRVKTRLGKGIGMVRAAWWFRHQAARLIRTLSADPRWQTVLAVAPDVEGMNSRVWPGHVPRVAQGAGDLGQRMAHVMRVAQTGPVVLVGADIPGITAAHIARAFKALGNHDAVFGPAEDGGFWLVGLKGSKPLPRGLFDNVRWSTEHALADTMVGLKGLSIAQTDRMRDVDTAADLAIST